MCAVVESIFGELFLYSTNIYENTQGNPGLPWVIIEFWRHFQQNPGYFEFRRCLGTQTLLCYYF